MLQLISIFVGGGLGSLCRYAVGAYLIKSHTNGGFPWATFAVNVIGCLLIGLLSGALQRRGADLLYMLLVTGFCGGFTTFSTFSNECFTLLRQGATGLALAYLALSLFCGVIAVGAGFLLMKNA